MATVKEMISYHENIVKEKREQAKAILDRAERGNQSHLTAEQDREAEKIFAAIDVSRGKIAELKQMQAEDDAMVAAGKVSIPTSAARSTGAETHFTINERAMPGALPGAPSSNGLSERDEAPSWIRTSDGKNAAVARSERVTDNAVAQAELDRNAERNRVVVGQHGDFGSYVRAMTTSGASAIVPTVWSANIIDRARNASVMYQAGAQTVVMDAKTVQIGRLTADPAPAFKTEGSPVTPGDMTYDYVQLTASSLTALVVVSLEFLADAPAASESIQNALAKSMALEIDKAAMFGQLGATGTNDEGAAYGLASPYPKGILKNLGDNAPGNIIGTFPTNGTSQNTGNALDRATRGLL